jgi:hypothetical protein
VQRDETAPALLTVREEHGERNETGHCVNLRKGKVEEKSRKAPTAAMFPSTSTYYVHSEERRVCKHLPCHPTPPGVLFLVLLLLSPLALLTLPH